MVETSEMDITFVIVMFALLPQMGGDNEWQGVG